MSNLALFDQTGSCAKDGTMEMLGRWEGGFEFFDPAHCQYWNWDLKQDIYFSRAS